MRRLIYSLIIFILIGGIILTAYAPDRVSMVFIVIMEAIVFIGVIIGVMPVIQYDRALKRALRILSGHLKCKPTQHGQSLLKMMSCFNSEPWMSCFEIIRRRCKDSGNPGRFWLTSRIISMMISWA